MGTTRPRILGYRETQVLQFAQATIEAEGIAPTYAMICNELGISTKGEVSRIVAALERRLLLKRVGSGKVRRIRLPHMVRRA
jgi:SOS-response transcriptional repressor LexA